MSTLPPQQQQLIQAQALDSVLQQILSRRPDLQREALQAALVARAQASPYSLQTWAEHCLERVRRGEPLPWEPGATGAGADA